MNLMPLAALLLSCLAVAISVCTAIAVMRRPVRHLTSPVPRRRGPLMQDAARRRQVQVGGDGSTQLQSGGTLIIPATLSTTGLEQRINLDPAADYHSDVANAVSERMGRHL
jgi:hypothetical protein